MSDDQQQILVVDVGTSSVKAGYSGEDVPSYVFPSTNSKMLSKANESFEPIGSEYALYSPVYRGIVKDWNQIEKLWSVIIEQASVSSSESTSVLLVESPLSSSADRAKWAEILFETYRYPSICFGNSSSLSIFASGRTSGVAVECGAGITSSVPIFEGLALKHAAVYTDFGGLDISANLKKLLAEKNIQVDNLSAKKIKERLAYVDEYAFCSENIGDDLQMASFSLPDGTDVTVDRNILTSCSNQLFVNKNEISGGLISQVHESIVLCDESLKRDLTNNIIISGGTSMLPGLSDKLQKELKTKFEEENDPMRQYSLSSLVRVVPNSNYREKGYTSQRKHAAWIGGSLVSSFETYHKNLKITRQEWEEKPDLVLHSRCI